MKKLSILISITSIFSLSMYPILNNSNFAMNNLINNLKDQREDDLVNELQETTSPLKIIQNLSLREINNKIENHEKEHELTSKISSYYPEMEHMQNIARAHEILLSRYYQAKENLMHPKLQDKLLEVDH